MSEQLLEGRALIEQPLVAFFMPETSLAVTDLWSFTKDFAQQHQALLPHGHGMIAQVATEYPGSAAGIGAPSATLLFDMRRSAHETYTWQLSVIDQPKDGRIVCQTVVSPTVLSRYYFRLDHQGKLAHTEAPQPDTWENISMSQIVQQLQLETNAQIVRRHLMKTRTEQSLADFAVHQTVVKIEYLPKEPPDEGFTIRQKRVKLAPAAFEEEYQKRQKLIQKLGFVPLDTYESSVGTSVEGWSYQSGTLPILWPSRRPIFSKPATVSSQNLEPDFRGLVSTN